MNLQEFCSTYNYKLATEIPKDWDRYWNSIPSVTTILWLLIDENFNMIKRYNSKSIKESVESWLQVHSDAELFFKPNNWTTECNLNVIKFHSYYNVKIIWAEVPYKKDITWKIDLVCDINWTTYNIDYKYANYKSIKYHLQMMWYKYLNWYDGKLVYLKWKKLEVIDIDNSLYDIFIELKDYFLKLLNEWRICK